MAVSMGQGPPLLLLLLGLCSLRVASRGVWQWPRVSCAQAGGSVNISCSSPSNSSLLGLYLRQEWPRQSNAVYYEDGQEPTVHKRFEDRVSFSGLMHNLTITLRDLQLADSGLYTCVAISQDSEPQGTGTLLVVTEAQDLEPAAHMRQETWLPNHLLVALAVGFFLLGLGLGAVCVLKRSQVKSVCGVRNKPSLCEVYEDMSYSRHHPQSSPNDYV